MRHENYNSTIVQNPIEIPIKPTISDRQCIDKMGLDSGYTKNKNKNANK